MITIKLDLIEPVDIDNYQKQFTSVKNFAFNRFFDGQTQNQIRKLVKTKLNHIELMDTSFQHEAINEATKFLREKQEIVIFGGKKNWKDYNKHKITKEEYQKKKLSSIFVRGETSKTIKGNRKFELDTKNHQIIFKPNRKTKIYCKYQTTKQDKILEKLQNFCELRKTYFTIRLASNYIAITFDEKILRKEKYALIKKRILAIDLNPNYIGIVVRDKDRILHKEILGLYDLNQSKNTNKKKFEDYEIVKHLTTLAKHYRCEYFAYEKLTIESNDRGKGKWFNRTCNSWRRKRVTEGINKWCNIIGMKVQEVIPEYSSFIGQIRNEDDYDSIAAAIELSRRAWLFISYYRYNDVQEVKGNIVGINRKLPKFLADRWKKKLNSEEFVTYKSLYLEIKKSEYSYRNLFNYKLFSLRLGSKKSLVDICCLPSKNSIMSQIAGMILPSWKQFIPAESLS